MIFTRVATVHRDAFCQFLFRWIYYCHSSKSTGRETSKTYLCTMGWVDILTKPDLSLRHDKIRLMLILLSEYVFCCKLQERQMCARWWIWAEKATVGSHDMTFLHLRFCCWPFWPLWEFIIISPFHSAQLCRATLLWQQLKNFQLLLPQLPTQDQK